jgi:hypothetical protein
MTLPLFKKANSVQRDIVRWLVKNKAEICGSGPALTYGPIPAFGMIKHRKHDYYM